MDAGIILLTAAVAGSVALLLRNIPEYSRSRRWLWLAFFLGISVALAAITIIMRPR